MNITGTIKEWAFVDRWPYRAPEAKPGMCVSGRVFGHKGIPDEGSVTTNLVVTYDPESNTVATKSGSTYKLEGEPSSEWLNWCNKNGYKPQDYLDRLAQKDDK